MSIALFMYEGPRKETVHYCVSLLAVAVVDGVAQKMEGCDLTPNGIKSFLKIDQPVYSNTAQWGHFGRGFEWK